MLGVTRLIPILAILAAVVALACGSGANDTSADREAQSTPLAGAAGPAATQTSVSFPMSVEGSDGRSLTLTQAPRRIICLSPGHTEILFAIGAGPQVVATDRFSNYPEAAKALPKVEYTKPSIEALAGFRPDLIITSARQKDSIPAIQAAGLPVVLLEEPVSVQGVLERVRLFGRVTGRSAEAEQLASGMEARVRAVTERVAGVERGPRVYHELSPQLHTATPSSFVGDLYTLLKARNIAEGGPGPFPQLSQEVIVQRDPEVIVLAQAQGTSVDQVRSRPGWSAVTAVRTGRIYQLTQEQVDWVSRPGPRVVDGLELLLKLLYP